MRGSVTDLRSYESIPYSMSRARQWNTFYAALPVVVIMLLPLFQIQGLIYFYDLVLGFSIFRLGLPQARVSGAGRYRSIWRLFIIIIMIGCLSAVVRTGLILRPTLYTVQYLLGLIYARTIYENIIAGRLNLQSFASIIVWAGVTLAGIGILQFLLFQFNPFLAARLYRQYLEFSGFDTRFFDVSYMASVKNEGMVRVVGTWDVTTTYAGMLTLSAAWLLISKPPQRQKLVLLTLIAVAVLMTGSRHGWLITGLLFFGLARGSLPRQILTIIAFVSVFLAVIFVLDTQSSANSEILSLREQIDARFKRTFEQGLKDSSIQFRYFDGTRRFLSYAAQDPTMLVLGVGTGTDKGLYDALGPDRFYAMMSETYNMGFVSNGWLLIWRNWGILAVFALFSLFAHISRLRGSAAPFGLLTVGLIFLADNYSAHVARCFVLLYVFLTALAAQGIVESKLRFRSK